MTALDVRLHGRLVATVEDAAGRLVLTWADDLLEVAPPGTPVLSVRLDAQPVDVHPPAALVRSHLGGLLPEVGTSPRARLARRAAANSADVLALLAAAGGDVPGAATFTPRGAPAPQGWFEPLADDRAVREHLERSQSDEHVGVGDSSLPGVQPKAALTRSRGRWFVPHAGAPSTHILKPQLPERPALVHDEALSSRAARAVGLRAAVSHVEDFDGLAVLVVPRFDRRVPDDGPEPPAPVAGTITRIHQEDAAQALGLTSDDIEAKFGWHRPAANLRSIAAVLAGNGGDVGELLRLTTLNVLLGNTDAHAKNISLLHAPDGRVELAPAYDVSPHAQYGRTRLALSVNGGFDLPAVGLEDLVAEGRSWRIPSRRATAIVREVRDRLDAWLAGVDDADALSEPALAWVRRSLDRTAGTA
ncbi:type II toxin-antitoxin system HipA family toxin [Kineococcus sp. SYSU DK002]|uniref:type II toxin-antitoxin system HipA family toxin n=1 Tax=Kineococcus sp. SYSU DK002 TaxID=3383123 RepID=UPI003D7CC255